MNAKALCVALAALTALTHLAFAEDAPEAAPEKTEAAALPGVGAKAQEAPKAPEPACLLKASDAKDIGCAASYRPVADAYLVGYKAMDGWIAGASAQVAGAEEKVVKAEGAVRENESAMTALKLERSKDSKAKLKDLSAANKQLWRDLEAARREQASICKGFKREAMQKVRELNAAVSAALSEAQKAE